MTDELIKALLKDARRARFIDWMIYAAVVGLPAWLVAIYIELTRIRAILERSAQ